MSTAKIVLGDDVILTVTLEDDAGDAVAISEDDTVMVALTRVDGSALLTEPIEADPDEDDANWSQGIITVPISGDDTASLTVAKIDVEVQVTTGIDPDTTQTTYFATVPLVARKGLIP